MDNQPLSHDEQLSALTEIRAMMERSSRFISLSGLSGVAAGCCALVGAYMMHSYLSAYIGAPPDDDLYLRNAAERNYPWGIRPEVFFLLDAGLTLLSALAFGIFFTARKARSKGLKVWSPVSIRLFLNLMIPMVAGGIFCLLILLKGFIMLVPGCMLLFYGLALVNGSKYTLEDIRYLGICQIFLGLLATAWLEYGLYIWAFGFGVMHIVYGVAMYFKYEKN